MIVLLLAQAAIPQAAPSRDVVVVGRRLGDDLARCIARHCPVREDAAQTLALARQQFVDGDYRAARRTLDASLKRNRRFGRTDPLPVAALWRDKAKVEAHLGEYDAQRASIVELVQTHRVGLPSDDPERLAGLIELGDVEFHLGRARAAEGYYREALSSAEHAGRDRVGAIARYRLASSIIGRGPARPSADEERQARAWLQPLIGAADPALASFDFPARLLLARIEDRRGAPGQVDALLASYPRSTRAAPRLLSAEPMRLGDIGGNNCAQGTELPADGVALSSGTGCDSPENRWLTTVVERQWIDVGFRIEADGRVAEVELVRQSGRLTGDWSERVLRSVRSRRYAVPAASGADAALARLERFTLTAPYELLSSSRIRSRVPGLVIETADLTPELPSGS